MRHHLMLLSILLLTTGPVLGQSFGLMLGGRHGSLSAAGKTLMSSDGLTMNVFIPFYINDRFVVRAEAGLLAERYVGAAGESSRDRGTRTSISLGVVGRFYASRSISFTSGIQFDQRISPADTVISEHRPRIPNATDLKFILGTAYRFSNRVELGVRYGEGLLVAMDAGAYGRAKNRAWYMMASYLIRNKPQPLTKRRQWRAPLANNYRY